MITRALTLRHRIYDPHQIRRTPVMRRQSATSRPWVVVVALGLAACEQDSGPLAPTGHGAGGFV